jgi:hypothetical protein
MCKIDINIRLDYIIIMNYYIIPKNNCNIKLKLYINNEQPSPCISYSLIHYLNNVYTQLFKIDDKNTDIKIDFINKIINPFEFINTNVPGSIISVSKVKPKSNIFFELIEIFQTCNIIDFLSSKNQMNIAHLTPNHSSSNYLIDIIREDQHDIVISEDFDYENICNLFIRQQIHPNLDLIIIEFKSSDLNDVTSYIKNMLLTLCIIIKYQANLGTCIIKVDNIFYKPIIDIIFIFSGIYDKVYVIKPSISKITTGERYIVCKSLNVDLMYKIQLMQQVENNVCVPIYNFTLHLQNIHSVIENDISYYFLNKIEESNTVIGQQQITAYTQIINIFKNKNRDDKIDTLTRNHIQKCIQWCEKNQIPHNKFVDKINIFLIPKLKETQLLIDETVCLSA